MSPSLPGFTIVPCVDSLLCYRLIKRPKCILQDSPKIYDICMHLYNCIWVILLISRLNLAFLSLKLSRGIDIVLVCLYPCGFDNPRNTLRWKLLQLASVCLRIILFGLRTVNIFQTLSRAKKVDVGYYAPVTWTALNFCVLVFLSTTLTPLYSTLHPRKGSHP
jgi:hypothetical protein